MSFQKKRFKRIIRAIIWLVVHYKRLSSTIKRVLCLDVSLQTIQLILLNTPHVKYIKHRASAVLQKYHFESRKKGVLYETIVECYFWAKRLPLLMKKTQPG